MKYLIIGGCGFLGTNMAEYLINRNASIIVYDNLYRYGSERNLVHLKNLKNKFAFIKGDIRNQYEIEPVIKKERPDIIFNFAGQVAMTTSIENPMLDFEVNTRGTLNVLESVRKYSPESIVCYSSTNKVYGDLGYLDYKETETRYICKEYPNGFNESIPLDFHSPYGCSKGAADQYMLDYARIFGLKTIVFRHSSIFGVRQFATEDQGWIGWFCQKAYEKKTLNKNEPFNISGTGKQVRDILFSSDLISCYESAIENISKTKGNVYNIGGGVDNSLSLIELFNYLEGYLEVEMNYSMLPFRKSDQKIFVADIAKAKIDFSWQPKVDTKTGIGEMYTWLGKIALKTV